MKRDNFARLCLAVSLVGLGIMYLSTQVFEPEKVSPSNVSEEDLGSAVRVEGNVSGFSRAEDVSFFTLKGGAGEVDVVDFEGRSFEEGSSLEVTGQVELYQGDVQVVASEVR